MFWHGDYHQVCLVLTKLNYTHKTYIPYDVNHLE